MEAKLQSDRVEKAKVLAREEPKLLLAEIHEESRRKVEEERQKAVFFELDFYDPDTNEDSLRSVSKELSEKRTKDWVDSCHSQPLVEECECQVETDKFAPEASTQSAIKASSATIPPPPSGMNFPKVPPANFYSKPAVPALAP